MNPLKLRLPETIDSDPVLPVPGPLEVKSWLVTLDDKSARNIGQAMQGLLHGLNRRSIPALQRLETLTLVQPKVHEIVTSLRSNYRNHPSPLIQKVLVYAELARQLVTETALGYKVIVNEAICNSDDDGLTTNMFLIALRQAIEGLGQHLLECYIQYSPAPEGHWGELHRLYQFADRNGLSTMSISPLSGDDKPLTTIQHTYLRVVMLGLTQPNHLMTGQAEMIYGYLDQWTVGCRMERRMETLASAGDMFVDLASDRPPAIATGYARFRPVDGRFLDISFLQNRLEEMRVNLKPTDDRANKSLDERMRRDMLSRLCSAWAGRGERGSERADDGQTPVLTCIGLGASHHFIGQERDYTPEQDEIRHLKPWDKSKPDTNNITLTLRSIAYDEEIANTLSPGVKTRVSNFGEETDVWTMMHNRDINAREQRKAALAKYIIEPWKRINHSRGGLALKRAATCRSQLQVGSLTAFRDDNQNENWRIGIIRWLQDNGPGGLDIGIMALANSAEPIAVRAIGGAGAGGEYFRSLLIESIQHSDGLDELSQALLVPAYIYDIHSQLVLNRQSGLQFVRLTRLLETSSTFSLFAYKPLEMTARDHQAMIEARAKTK